MSPVSLNAQSSSSVVIVPIAPARPPVPQATIAEFRKYLLLTGFGEQWKVGWIAAVDMNRSIGAPYWPEKFWSDIRNEMRATDIAPIVAQVYAKTFDQETMEKVNTAIEEQGLTTFAATSSGQLFCHSWAAKEQDGKKAIFDLTQSTIERVYERDKPMIKAARASYLAAHPDYKD